MSGTITALGRARALALGVVLGMLAAIPAVGAPFEAAKAPYHFVFPRDHGAHFGYRSEWWYFTGHLRTPDGRRFGYELTIFRYGLRPGLVRPEAGESRWRGSQVYPAHFAITDERGGTFAHYETFSREALGAGGASASGLDVHSGRWRVSGEGPIRLHADADGNAIDLREVSEKVPAVHGAGGTSRKAACASCASHYYSLTRLATRGTLAYGGTKFEVDGLSWMDHEFGSDELQADQVGWDWFSIQLDDRREVMLYRLRRRDGTTTPQSSGSVIEAGGRVRHLSLADFTIEALGEWKSPKTGGRYPSGWRLRIPSERIDLSVKPAVLDQELADARLGVSYWEGACDVSGADRGRPVRGAAYVELTGYAGTVRL